ncbi:hypothetical protein [Mucilaginibacter celer]|uniref:Uncharacterized protein n=1 Tax=Mucilaginibacter celer TaxID=2305508 RepID=A0A494VU66_9SPHI|nr:hypothetical protein [Mucilaginibacter celer]AYL99137.1 hypothetical protein HYN43_029410 [Mucilaginibacter celer]
MNDPYLDSLKYLVLIKGNTLLSVSHEAKQLSELITRQTNHQIAEVTILRLYGFMTQKFPPSAFTKNTLAQFCGFENYVAFCEEQESRLE